MEREEKKKCKFCGTGHHKRKHGHDSLTVQYRSKISLANFSRRRRRRKRRNYSVFYFVQTKDLSSLKAKATHKRNLFQQKGQKTQKVLNFNRNEQANTFPDFHVFHNDACLGFLYVTVRSRTGLWVFKSRLRERPRLHCEVRKSLL